MGSHFRCVVQWIEGCGLQGEPVRNRVCVPRPTVVYVRVRARDYIFQLQLRMDHMLPYYFGAKSDNLEIRANPCTVSVLGCCILRLPDEIRCGMAKGMQRGIDVSYFRCCGAWLSTSPALKDTHGSGV